MLEAAGRLFGFELEWKTFDWSCEVYARTGRMMPEDGLEQLRQFEAIYLGAVGFPGVPDHVSLWGLLIPIRRGFRQYINLRPVRLLKGARSPLAGRAPGDDRAFLGGDPAEEDRVAAPRPWLAPGARGAIRSIEEIEALMASGQKYPSAWDGSLLNLQSE